MRARVNTDTRRAPLLISSSAALPTVAPVVITSSIRRMRRPETRSGLLHRKALRTFSCRREFDNPTCEEVALTRSKIMPENGTPILRAIVRAISPDWLNPRSRLREECRGIGSTISNSPALQFSWKVSASMGARIATRFLLFRNFRPWTSRAISPL